MTLNVQGPSWELRSEYSSVDAPELNSDLEALDRLHEQIAAQSTRVSESDVAAAQAAYKLSLEATRLLDNLSTYASCLLSVDQRRHACGLSRRS